MENFPELDKIIGRPKSGRSIFITVSIVFIVLVLATIIFLILTGYINFGSPTEFNP
jgi:hypothetical protein